MSWGIVGYRHFTDRERFDAEMERLVEERGMPTRVVSGCAPGADTLAEEWAKANGVEFLGHPPKAPTALEYKARNTKIVRDSELIVAFVSTKSRGTHDTLNKAHKADKPTVTIHVD